MSLNPDLVADFGTDNLDDHPEGSMPLDDRPAKNRISRAQNENIFCAHCGLPVRPCYPSDDRRFCCSGCRSAHELIHCWGLGDYYTLRDQYLPANHRSASAQIDAKDNRWEDFDNPELLGESVPRQVGESLCLSQCTIRGLHCGACAWLIERSVALVPGWHSAKVRMSDHSIELLFDPNKTRLSVIAKTLAKLGYGIGPLLPDSHLIADRIANRTLLIRIAVAAFCAANAMWIAVALYAGNSTGIATGHFNLLRLAGSLLGILAVFGPGYVFLKGALASVRTRTPHMDLPVSVALVVGAIAGLVGSLTGHGEVFFDSITMLVLLLLTGRWVQFRQQRKATESVQLLLRISPQVATLVNPEGVIKKVPIDRVRCGDHILIDAGQPIAADGTVIDGVSAVDRSLLTGESQAVDIEPGDGVEAGAINVQSQIKISVNAVGNDTRVGKLMRLVQEASENKTPIIELADRVGGWFIFTVLILAIVTTCLWWHQGIGIAISHTIALLIVACPCALAIATPLALSLTIGRAAKRCILVRGADVIERLADSGTAWFDKTGTLTDGQLEVTYWKGSNSDLRALAELESLSDHPIARAIVLFAESHGIIPSDGDDQNEITEPDDINQSPGGGIVGNLRGVRVAIGNSRYMHANGIKTEHVEDEMRDLSASGISPILYSVGSTEASLLGVSDSLKVSASRCVDLLKAQGWQVGILSGDNHACVQEVAHKLLIPSHLALGDQSPESKLERIRQTPGNVLMIGDGVNDSAALAAAGVGVAVRGGAEVSLEAAPVFISDANLTRINELLIAAKRTMRLIRRAFAVSLVYNSISIILAMSGFISPMIAALIMPVSSLTVLAMTVTAKTFPDDII